MNGLTPYQQRQLFKDVQEIKSLLQMRGPVSQWVEIEEAEKVAGCKKRKIQRLVKEGAVNIRRTGKKTNYLRTDLEAISIQNSTLRQ